MADKKTSQFTVADSLADTDALGVLKPTGTTPAWDNRFALMSKLWDWIFAKSDPPSALTGGAAWTDATEVLVRQGTDELFRSSLGVRAKPYFQSVMSAYQPTPVYISTNTTLTAAAHNNRIIVCTGVVTLTIPATSREGFACTVKNRSSGDVTFSGHTHPDGHTKLATGRRGTLFGYTVGGTEYVELAGETS